MRRVARWARNLAIGGLAAVGLLGVIGLLMNDEVEGGDEGAFAQVPVDICRDLELETPPAAFTAGTDPTVDIDGEGIGAPAWQTVLPEPLDGRIEHVPGDDGDTVTLVMTVIDEDGAPTAHSVSYDVAGGEVRGQLHLDAQLQGAAGATQWYTGTQGSSSLLFPVVDQQIVECFAASPRPGSPTPPLAVEIDGDLQPLAPDSGQLAVTEDAALVLLRVDDTRPVQRLGQDGVVRRAEVGDVVSVHAAREAFHALVGTPDQAQLVALDPNSLEERWAGPFPADRVFDNPRLAATDTTLSAVVGLDDEGELHRFGLADGQPLGGALHGLDRPLLAADDTTTYAVDPTPGDGTDPTRVLRLNQDGTELEDVDTPVLQPGLQPVATTPTSVVLGARWEGNGAGGLLLRDGDVYASTAAPLVAVGTEHVLALTFVQGELLLVGLPLDAESAADGDDDPDEGDETPEDSDDAGDADDEPGDDPDDPAGGDGPSGTGDGGAGGGAEVTDNADIDEEWLP